MWYLCYLQGFSYPEWVVVDTQVYRDSIRPGDQKGTP